MKKNTNSFVFADTDGEAYAMNFDLIKAMFNLKTYATHNLKPMEFIKTYGNYGIELDTSVSYDPTGFLLANGGDFGFGKLKRF